MIAFIFGTEYSISEILWHYWAVFPIAIAVGLIATPLCRKIALRFHIVDMPDSSVKTHKKPTAYLGGIGMLAGVLAGLGVGVYILLQGMSHISEHVSGQTGGFTSDRRFNWLMLAGIALGAIIATGIGLLDDLRDLRPRWKFLGQAIAAAILVLVGVRPNVSHALGYIGIEQIPIVVDYIVGVPIVLFFILGATNSLNLLDGLDGLCAGVTAIIAVAFLLLAIILATWRTALSATLSG